MGMAKASRLLFILNLVRSRKSLNAGRLAEECGVTERSIYRDIVALSEVGIPIYYDKGYKCTTDNWLPPLNFDFEEYMTLRLALESSPLRKSSKYRDLLKQVSAKVEATLSERVKESKRHHSFSTVTTVRTTFKPELVERFQPVIEEAIDRNRCLSMMYDSLESGPAHRTVEPYFIIFRNHAFYMVGWCTTRKAFRTFRLDRMSNLQMTEERFLRRKGIHPESYFDGRWSLIDGPATLVQIRFRGAAAKVIESGNYHPGESHKREGDSVRYSVTVNGTEEIRRWILGFGAQAEVIAPVSLRNQLREIGQQIAATHGETEHHASNRPRPVRRRPIAD